MNPLAPDGDAVEVEAAPPPAPANGDGSVLAVAGPDATLGAPVAEDVTEPDVSEDADGEPVGPEPVEPEEADELVELDDVDTVTQDGELELEDEPELEDESEDAGAEPVFELELGEVDELLTCWSRPPRCHRCSSWTSCSSCRPPTRSWCSRRRTRPTAS